MAFHYEPSLAEEWLAVATPGRVLVARANGDAERVRMLSETWTTNVSVQEVLEILTSNGLGATEPFALVFWVTGAMEDKGLGVIVRGDATVAVDTEDGEVTVSSGGVTTWSEQVIERAHAFVVTLPSHAAGSGGELPLGEGVAWVRRIGYGAADAPQQRDVARRASGAGPELPAEAAPTGEATVTSAPSTGPAVDASGSNEGTRPGESASTVRVAQSADDREAPRDPAEAPATAPEETRVFHTVSGIAHDGTSIEASADQAGGPEIDHSYDFLFDATIVQSGGARSQLTQAADEADQPAASDPVASLGDHDGHTVLASDVQEARRSAREAVPGASGAHAVPVHDHRYAIVLPDGSRQPLTAPVVLGRAPSVSHVPASVLPHLITLTGDDISRSHVRIAVEGGTVVVTDLHSSNGTQIVAPGRPPQLLRGGEPTPVIAGTVVDLGSGVVLQITGA